MFCQYYQKYLCIWYYFVKELYQHAFVRKPFEFFVVRAA